MALNLLEQGWPVHVCDIDASKLPPLVQAGAVIHPNSAQTAANTDLLIVCVVDSQQTHDVLFGPDGAVHQLKPHQAVLLCPTIAPEDVEVCANKLSALGIHTLDAPMSGGPARARVGSMSLMLACTDAVFEKYQDLIAALSTQVFRISQKPGDGARTKLVNNLLAAINLAGAAEVMALAERMGLDLTTTLNVIERSSGQSWIGSDRMRRAIADDFEPLAHTTLLTKDSKLAVSAANKLGFNTPVGTQAYQTFQRAIEFGLAAEDDASLFKLMQNNNLNNNKNRL